jgi:hypothetical protein
MATTTPNYGWPVPTSTDLVKNGATAIEALGDAIDATVFAQAPGLVKISSTSFSAVASQAISSCFSSTYRNYKVIIDITGNSTTADLFLKLRATSTDSSTDYSQAVTVTTTAGSTTNLSQSAVTTGFRVNGVYTTISTYHSQTSQIDLFRPFESVWTTHNAFISYRSAAGDYYGGSGTGLHAVATSYDGLNLIASAGTITGVVTVYGYKD